MMSLFGTLLTNGVALQNVHRFWVVAVNPMISVVFPANRPRMILIFRHAAVSPVICAAFRNVLSFHSFYILPILQRFVLSNLLRSIVHVVCLFV